MFNGYGEQVAHLYDGMDLRNTWAERGHLCPQSVRFCSRFALMRAEMPALQ
jgi:hypothetical protein